MVKQIQIVSRVSCCLLSLALLVGFSGRALAEPVISQVSLLEGDRVEQGARVRILGSGFGSKAKAAPVLIDYVDHAFEYGVRNDVNAKLNDMSLIPTSGSGDAGAVWARRNGNFFYTTQGQHRHGNATASYFFEGESTWIGGPVAYGGASGWDTPVDNPQLYVSWWYKNKYHSTFYWRFLPESLNGQFKVGEDLVIEGQDKTKSQGVYVGVDDEGFHNAVFYNHRNANDLVGALIRGLSSGAETVFPDPSRVGPEYGYRIPGSKLARVWDDPKGVDGIRSSVALHDAYAATAKMYYSLGLDPNEWVHLEYEIDTDKGRLRVFENGKLLGEDYFSPDATYQGAYSPTLALLGTNAKQLKLQKSWISEIYVDSSLQRVVIGNAPNYQDVTHRELQRPTAWSSDGDEIEVTLHLGSLSFDQDLYLYVIDRNGVASNVGAPLCTGDACPVPPTRIELMVN